MSEYDFYRCCKCHRLLTAPEVDGRMKNGDAGKTGVCPCGGLKISPANLPTYGWLLPSVWWFAYLRLRGVA